MRRPHAASWNESAQPAPIHPAQPADRYQQHGPRHPVQTGEEGQCLLHVLGVPVRRLGFRVRSLGRRSRNRLGRLCGGRCWRLHCRGCCLRHFLARPWVRTQGPSHRRSDRVLDNYPGGLEAPSEAHRHPVAVLVVDWPAFGQRGVSGELVAIPDVELIRSAETATQKEETQEGKDVDHEQILSTNAKQRGLIRR